MARKITTTLSYICCVMAAVISQAESYEKSFLVHSGEKLVGCDFKLIEDVPHSSFCSQFCVSENWRCQSFNYNHRTRNCQLNSCKTSGSGVMSDTHESFYAVASSSAPNCEDVSSSGCHPVFTKECSNNNCICHGFASGTDCTQVSMCTEEKCLTMIQEAADLDSANTVCAGLMGHVLTVDSYITQQWVETLLRHQYSNVTEVYLGLRFEDVYQGLAYVSNMQPLTGYSNWLTAGQSTAKQPCVKMSSGEEFKWVGVDCNVALPYFCEVPVCETPFVAFNGSCYYFDNVKADWTTSGDVCKTMNSRSGIVSVASDEEMTYLTDNFATIFGSNENVFLGLSKFKADPKIIWHHNEWLNLDWGNPWEHLGCYISTQSNAINSLEGNWCGLSDDPTTRADAVEKCWYSAKELHNKVYVLRDGGYCHSDANASFRYDNEGLASGCVGGEGGVQQLDAYRIPNHNLYMSYDFCHIYWNDNGQMHYMFWSPSNWLWHDGSEECKSVCKVHLCPQGFMSFNNKCFKISNKLLTREDSRDECQRYDGADLYNPEYEDEAAFLSSAISHSDLSQSLNSNLKYWTGIIYDDTIGEPIYEVMDKTVGDNFNALVLGAEPLGRKNTDNAGILTHVELRYTFSSPGVITGWEYYGKANAKPINFYVLRANDIASCTFTVVGVHSTTTSIGYSRLDVTNLPQINVQTGDYVAMSFTSGAAIRMSSDSRLQRACNINNILLSSTVGDQITLGSQASRIYSFRALWRPDTLVSDSPFKNNSFSGGRCFAADYSSNMLVEEADCDERVYSICELKKYNRQ